MLDFIGKAIGVGMDLWNAGENRKLQKQAMHHGIEYKVNDAKRAGVHPLAALGAQTFNPSPISLGAAPETVASMGQDITRAVAAGSKPGTAEQSLTKVAAGLELENRKLQNEYLAAQIAKIKQAGQPPGIPSPDQRHLIDGQLESGIKISPIEQGTTAPGAPSQEAGAVADIGYSRTPSGWAPVRSKDLMDRSDDDFIGMLTWNARNRLYPSFGFNLNPPNTPLKPGHVWVYSPVKQEYYQVKPRYYK